MSPRHNDESHSLNQPVRSVQLAVEDALVLGEILAVAADWNETGSEFERRRRLRVEHVQTMTDRLSRAARLPPWLRDPILWTIGPHSYQATYEPLRKAPADTRWLLV